MYLYHYVYRITNLRENKHYYGSRTSKGIPPKEDIGFKYFSSSTDKDFIFEQNNHPLFFKYKIIMVFDTRKLATKFESKLHKKFDVKNNEKFYNKSNQSETGFSYSWSVVSKKNLSEKMSGENNPMYGIRLSGELNGMFGKKHTDEVKELLRIKSTGVKASEETKKKMSNNSYIKGKTRTEEENQKNRESNSGSRNYMFGRTGEQSPMFGRRLTEEQKQKISESKRGELNPNFGIPDEKVICPYCLFVGGKKPMFRWHFEKCKYKLTFQIEFSEDTLFN